MPGDVNGVAIRDAASTEIEVVRNLFEEYAAALGVDLCFQDFARELASLPGAYAPPRGCLLVAWRGETALGCVALRPLDGDRVAEMKRLYVRPAARGTGLGRRLARAVVARARSSGYRQLKLDTLETMAEARSLYASLGFRPCPAYYDNPLPGVAYLSLDLGEDIRDRAA